MTLQTFGLTAEQLLKRKSGIGGSDANVLMSGDANRIMQLWLEKTGQAEGEDLSRVLPVQMGLWTEPLNIHWYTMTSGNEVVQRGEQVTHRTYDWMRCTLDGLVPAESAVFEAKHVNAFSKIDAVIQKYMPQLHHNMAVCNLSRAILSVFLGTQTYEMALVEADPFYTATLMDAERAFWDSVTTMTPPGDMPAPVAPPSPTLLRTVDMTGSNAWASLADDWKSDRLAAKRFKAAEEGIKELVEFDVGEASGHGICVKRSKAGALTIREIKNA